jgi:hypothetical protein
MKREAEVAYREPDALAHHTHTPRPASHHLLNIAIIALAILAPFWRVLLFGETLIDAATLENQLPWGYAAGATSGYPYDRRDLTDMYVTRDYFVVSSYLDGELPLWNPYTMAGHPIYADGVTRIFSPMLLFYTFLDIPEGYSVARIVELLLAAIFMYVFLVGIGAGPAGGLAGSLVFGLSAHSMLHLTGLGWWGGLMWLPLIMLFVHRAVQRQSFAQAAVAGLMLAAQFLCGYMPNQIYYVGAVALYYLFFAFAGDAFGSRKRFALRMLALMTVTLGVGFLISATQWVPMMELLRHSNRRIVGAELGYIYLPPWYGATLVFPNLFGEAYDVTTLTLFTAIGVSHDHILYLSIAGLALLCFALYSPGTGERPRAMGGDRKWVGLARRAVRAARERPLAAFFILLAVVSLIIMMTAPVYVRLTRYIPVLQVIRVAVRAGVLFLFATSVLAAFGMDALLRSDETRLRAFARMLRTGLIAAAAFAATVVAGSYLARATGFAAETGSRGALAYARRVALALSEQFTPPGADLLIPIALLISVTLLLRMRVAGKLTSNALAVCFIVLIIGDLYWVGAQFNKTYEAWRVFPRTELTNYLESEPGRVLVVPSGLESNRRVFDRTNDDKIIAPPNTLLPYRISTVTGKNQQFPRWYREYASLIEPQPHLSHVVFDKPRSPFLDLLGVRYVLSKEKTPVIEGMGLLTRLEGITVYLNTDAMPRAFFVNRTVIVSNQEQSLEALGHPDFDHRTTAVIEAPQGPTQIETETLDQFEGLPSGEARIIEDKRNRVVVETTSLQGGLLVLSDNYYPGWKASVDGQPSLVFRANHTMRAVRVPAGNHVVSFEFAPVTFWTSVYVSAAATGVTFAAIAVATLRARRKRRRNQV